MTDDWFVFTRKTALMQRIADLVRTGHLQYVCGEIDIAKAAGLTKKFSSAYQVCQTRLQASRQRSSGNASFRLLLWHQTGSDVVGWWLLHTRGRTPEQAQRERWRDAVRERIEMTGYELVRLTRPGAHAPSWTWRYTAEREQQLRAAVIDAIRAKRDDLLAELIATIWRTPGFAGARAQVKKMRDLIFAEWRRAGRPPDAVPPIPARIGYVRRVPDVGMRLFDLGRRARGHRRG